VDEGESKGVASTDEHCLEDKQLPQNMICMVSGTVALGVIKLDRSIDFDCLYPYDMGCGSAIPPAHSCPCQRGRTKSFLVKFGSSLIEI